MMKRLFPALVLALITPSLASGAASLNATDRAYLTNAMQSELGRYAIASAGVKNGSASVKSFAQALSSRSAQQTRELDSIAKSAGVRIPTAPLTRDAYHYSQLQGLSGADFGRMFKMDLTIDDQMLLSREQQELKGGHDPRLKKIAAHRAAALQRELSALAKIK